jgi:hypothetical protein
VEELRKCSDESCRTRVEMGEMLLNVEHFMEKEQTNRYSIDLIFVAG